MVAKYNCILLRSRYIVTHYKAVGASLFNAVIVTDCIGVIIINVGRVAKCAGVVTRNNMTITYCNALFAGNSITIADGIRIVTANGISCAKSAGIGSFAACNRVVGADCITGNRVFLTFGKQAAFFFINNNFSYLVSGTNTQRAYTRNFIFLTKSIALGSDCFITVTCSSTVITPGLVCANGGIDAFSFGVNAVFICP